MAEKTLPPGSVRRTFGIAAQVALLLSGVALVSALLEPQGPRRVRLFWTAAAMAVAGSFLVVTARRTDPGLVEGGPLDRLPPRERIKSLMVLFPVVVLSLGTLSVLTARDLWRLHTGQTEAIRLWSPVGLIYDLFGPWMAASVFPALAIIATVGIRGKWLRAREELRGESAAFEAKQPSRDQENGQ